MELKVSGKITKVLDVEKGVSKSDKEWMKMSFVLDTGSQYNPEIAFQLFGSEKIENFNKYNKVGDEVEVSFNVSSREYNGKYFHNIDAWKVFKGTKEAPQLNNSDAEDGSDLPF